MHPAAILSAPPPPDALSKDTPMPIIPRDRPSSSWMNGEPPQGMFAPPPSRPFPVPLAKNEAGDSKKLPQLGAPMESNSTGAVIPVSRVGAKTVFAVVIALVVLGIAAVFFLHRPR
jgi:hypothetical protein